MNNKFTPISNDNGYSVYENTDSELVELIKQVPNDGTFVLWNQQGIFKVEKELNEDQIMCVNDHGEYEVIKKDELEKLQKEGHLLRINKTYPVTKYFIDHFGEVEMGSHKILEVTDKFDKHQTKEYSGVHYRIHSWSFYDYGGSNTKFTYEEGNLAYKNAFIYFNEDGNYKIRDYNLNLIDANVPILTREQNLANFLNAFNRYKVLEHVEGTKSWFTESNKVLNVWTNLDDEDAWNLKIEVEEFPHSSGNRYFLPGESYRKVTKPKAGLVEVGVESIKTYLSDIIEKFSNKKEIAE
tara:strand:- start:10387 stop:11274 length:888 start_codon:yes stop_codon:yes gene_type:complete